MNAESLAVIEKPEVRRKRLDNPELARLKEELASAQRSVKRMSEAGITLVLGSDSGAGEVSSGWGTHNEMVLMVEAGLSPFKVIRIATRQGAERVSSGEPEFGVIKAGKIADLVLLDADPLEDIANTRKINRVMQAGQWLDRQALLK
jgi:imidazolonepropionase-like amidohydrolase